MLKRYLVALSLLCKASLSATIFEVIDTHRLIFCTFSSIHQNRISLEGGIIEKVMRPEGDIHLTLEEESRNVFVYSLVNHPQKTTISLILDDGTVQDIELDFAVKPSENLVLSYPQEVLCECVDPIVCQSVNEQEIAFIVQCILNGKNPPGYASCDCEKTLKNLSRGGCATLSGKLRGYKDTLYLWSIESGWRSRTKLMEKDFSQCYLNWVYLDKHSLKKGEKTFAIVSVSR